MDYVLRELPRVPARSGIATVLLCFMAGPAIACECTEASPQDYYDSADVIFVVRITATKAVTLPPLAWPPPSEQAAKPTTATDTSAQRSRIRRTTLEGAMPVTTVTRESI